MSWPTSTIGEVCLVVTGATPKTGTPDFWDGNIPWVTPKNLSDLQQKYLSDTPRKLTDAGFKSCSTNMLPAQSVLLSSRAPIGLVAINTIPVCTNQGFKSLVPRNGRVSSDYLYWWLVVHQEHLQWMGRGATFKDVSKKIVESIQIPLPPLAEQKRIAAILDAADALRTKRRESLAQLDTLLQSTFLEMFGDPVTNPMGFPRETLKSAFEFATGKLDSNAAVEGGKYPFFTCARQTFAIDDYAFDCEALLLAGNNATADYSVKHYKGKFNAYQRTYVITVDERLLTYEYARFALEYLLGDLKRFSKGTNTKYLTMVILNRMPILVPSISRQNRFASIVESVEAQKATQRQHLEELDTLFAALQQRAFNGELTT